MDGDVVDGHRLTILVLRGPGGLGETVDNKKAIGPGAQTSRPDDAGPARDLRGGMASPALPF
jgi:hypothetical protein